METASPDVCDLLDAVLEQDSPPGMKTTLYPYQKVMGILWLKLWQLGAPVNLIYFG